MKQVQRFAGSPAEWDAFVAAQPNGTSAHLYGWRRVIERVYGHDCPYFVAAEGDRITGALPLVDVRSLAFGRFLVSMPYLNAGGPLGDDNSVASLANAAETLAAERRAKLVEFRCLGEQFREQPYASEKVSCVLPLAAQTDQQWSALGGKLRSQIRRPQKEGIEVRFGEDQVEPFFRVFARNMRDLGSPTHPQSFFEAIRSELKDQAWFACAYYRGLPVAGGCAIAWRDEVEITWASALREFNAQAPNMLLYWAFIERAVSLGVSRFNFGRCTPGSGSHKFKLQWGAQDTPLYWYRWPASEQNGPPRQDRGSMAVAARIWRHMPIPVANLIGARLRGGIPA